MAIAFTNDRYFRTDVGPKIFQNVPLASQWFKIQITSATSIGAANGFLSKVIFDFWHQFAGASGGVVTVRFACTNSAGTFAQVDLPLTIGVVYGVAFTWDGVSGAQKMWISGVPTQFGTFTGNTQFQSTPPRRGDHRPRRHTRPAPWFQSTPPRRGDSSIPTSDGIGGYEAFCANLGIQTSRRWAQRPDSVHVGCPRMGYGDREPPSLPVRADGSRQTIKGPSTSWLAVEDFPGWDGHAEHFLEAERLGTELHAVGVMRLGAASLVLDGQGRNAGPALDDVGDSVEAELGRAQGHGTRGPAGGPGLAASGVRLLV
jgi:hypothetical protein